MLQEIDKRAADLDLMLKPSKCVSFLFDGAKHLSQGIPLSNGTARLISEGGTNFLGKLVDVSLSATKAVANRKVFSELLSSTDSLPIRGEYKLWIYRNYISVVPVPACYFSSSSRIINLWNYSSSSSSRTITVRITVPVPVLEP